MALIRVKPKKAETVLLTDLETTGLDHKKDIPIQIAAVKLVHSVNDFTDIHMSCKMEYKLAMPKGKEIISAEVARLNGYSAEVWEKEAVSRNVAYSEYLNELEWSSFGGQNPKFDWNFLDSDFNRTKFSWPRLSYYGLVSVDTMARPLKLLGYVPNLKQAGLVKLFGIGEQTHDALNDICQAAEIYRRCCWLSEKGFKDSNVQEAVDMKSLFI